MNDTLLLVTSRPMADESAEGYKLRITLQNGYEAWRDLTNPFLTTLEIRHLSQKLLLSRITGHVLDTLIAKADGKETIFNNHRVYTKYLGGTKICPDCIQEVGYQYGLFDLKAVNACIKHRRLLVDHCPKCVTFLNDDRPGFLQCRCLNDLSNVSRTEISPEVIDLESAIHAVAYRYRITDTDSQSGIPLAALSGMSLNTLLSFIESVGSSLLWSRRMIHRQAEVFDHQITGAAAEVLSDWPRNFIQFLADYSAMRLHYYDKQPTEWKSVFLDDAGDPYPEQETQFIHDQYLSYILNHWPAQRNDKKLDSISRIPLAEYSSNSLYAKITGTKPDWVSNQLASGNLFHVKLVNRAKVPKYILVTNGEQCQEYTGLLYNTEEAAKYLGMPFTLFKKLLNSGYLLQQYKVNKYQRFSKLDLDNFIDQLQPSFIDQPPPDEKAVTFPMACKLKKRFGVFPLYLLIKMLKGEINAINQFSTLDSALLLQSEVDRIFEECQVDRRSEIALFSYELRCINPQMLKEMTNLGVMVDQPANYFDLFNI